MTYVKQLKIGVDPVTEAKVSLRAQESGISVSEYVRSLILRDLDAGEAPRERETDEPPLTLLLLEVSLVTAILVRAQLGRSLGEDEAAALDRRAHEKAAERIRALVDDGSGR